jgi:TolB-like protein/tetratricopeptide (TPR) repeat protein
MPSFVSELQRRNVLRVAAAYALVAWIVIEAGSVLLPTFGASDTTFQTYVLIVLIGFVVSLVFAWVFEITPDGVKLDRDVDRNATPADSKGGLTNYAIIGLLIIALIVSVTFNVTDIRGTTEPSAAEIMMSRQSIAVLPFNSRSADPENTFFADGIHDDLLTKLANIGSLKVISRTSVMEYRDTTKNLRQIGQELGVDTLLEGTVQRVGTNARINVQLIDAETDEHLWARIYDRQITTENLFAVQSDISSEIAAALHTTLMPSEQLVVADVPTENLRAYSLYTTARDNLYERRFEPLQEARSQLEQAIELDPQYAEAYVALAESLVFLAINHQAIPTNEAFTSAGELIDKAFEINPELSDAYAALGLLKTSIWIQTRIGTENLEAESAFEQALAINPNHARAYMWFGNLRDAEQRADEAIGYYHRSMQLDPLGRVPYNNLPTLYAQRGENEYALRLWLEAINIHPEWPVPYSLVSAHLAGMGRLDEAFAWDRRSLQLSSAADPAGGIAFFVLLQFGDPDRAQALLDDMPAAHPFTPIVPGLRLMVEKNFVAANDFFMDYVENDEAAQFVYGLASNIALLAGDHDNSRKYMLLQNPILANDADLQIDRFTVRDIVKLAYILKTSGEFARSEALLNAALPVVQRLPRLGLFGQGVRDAQIYALLGQTEDALSALRDAVDAGYRSSIVFDNWVLDDDPYFNELREDTRFEAILAELDSLTGTMYERVIEAQDSGNWKQLTDLAGTI